MNTNIRL